MQKIIIVVMVTCLLAACAQVRPISEGTRNIRHIYNKSYKLDAKKSAYVGDEVIRVKDYYLVKKNLSKLRANDDFTVSATLQGSHKFNKGDVFNILGEVEDGEGYCSLVAFPALENIKYCVKTDGTISDQMVGYLSQKLIGSPKIIPRDIKFYVVTVEEVDKSRGYTNYELIFTGISEKNISLLYREFTSDDFARPAFYQNLTYPGNSKNIRFKKTLVTVLDVTPEQIEFIVTQDGLAD